MKAEEATTTNNPSNDRYQMVDATIKRFNYDKEALLEILNAAQESMGYLSEKLINYVAKQLHMPVSRVYGVATFYHMFTFEPLGEHNCIVCTGTACFVKGADQIINALGSTLNIDAGETTPDGLMSISTARCLGSCGLAPIVVCGGEVHGKATPASAVQRIHDKLSLTERALQPESPTNEPR